MFRSADIPIGVHFDLDFLGHHWSFFLPPLIQPVSFRTFDERLPINFRQLQTVFQRGADFPPPPHLLFAVKRDPQSLSWGGGTNRVKDQATGRHCFLMKFFAAIQAFAFPRFPVGWDIFLPSVFFFRRILAGPTVSCRGFCADGFFLIALTFFDPR